MDTQTNEQNAESSIDSLPSVLVNECASYLASVEDYINFAQSNKFIHSACYPSRLHTFVGFKHRQFKYNSKLFSSLVSLGIIKLNVFNDYIKYHPNPATMPKLRELSLYTFQQEDMDTFAGHNKHIPFDQVTTLHLHGSGEEYDFVKFVEFLLHFKNITHLTLDEIELEDFDGNDGRLIRLFPKLIAVRSVADTHHNYSAFLLKDYLLKRRSQHLISIQNESDWTGAIDDYKNDYWLSVQYPMLQELSVPLFDAETIVLITNNMPTLKKLSVEFIDGGITLFEDSGDADADFVKLLDAMFVSPNDLEYIRFDGYSICESEMAQIFNLIPSILLKSINQMHIKNEIFIEFESFVFMDDIPDQIEDCPVPRLVAALDKSGINNFMLKLNICRDQLKDHVNHINKLIGYFKKESKIHSSTLSIFTASTTSGIIIAISNGECEMNRLSSKWMIDL